MSAKVLALMYRGVVFEIVGKHHPPAGPNPHPFFLRMRPASRWLETTNPPRSSFRAKREWEKRLFPLGLHKIAKETQR